MTGPSCLCGHFDDCPACHEPNYSQHQVLVHLNDMSLNKRREFVMLLAGSVVIGGAVQSRLRRSIGDDVLTVDFAEEQAEGSQDGGAG